MITLLGALVAVLLIGAGSALAASYSNPTRIVIADNQPAAPYPSPIAASGLSGQITDVNVTLRGLSHTYLDDVGVVVESPGGQTLMLMNGVGPDPGQSAPSTTVTDIDLTFDDEAASQLANDAVPAGGSFRPTNYYPASGTALDPFESPGPGATYGNPGPAAGGTATLSSVFDGQEANGTWKLFVRDFAGNDNGEIPRGWSIEVTTAGGGGDTTPPQTQIDSGPSGTIAQSTAEFTFSSNEPGTFECSLDGAPFASCSSPKAYTGLSEGAHSFAVRAVDSASNNDLTPATRDFTVDTPDPPPPGDTTPPQTQIDSGPSGTIAQSTAEFTFSSNEPGTFECSLDGAPFASCSSPKAYTGLSEGAHSFAVRAVDSASNNDLTPATRAFTVDFPDPPPPPPAGGGADGQPPTVAITKITVKRAKRSAKVTFAGSDNVTAAAALRFTCKLDAKAVRPCTSPSVLKRLKPGKHKIEVRSIDAAGNESAPALKGFRVKKPLAR